jgi:hypothetical protein
MDEFSSKVKKLFSEFTFPPDFSNRTWFIIVFVLGMFLLSCMSNRCDITGPIVDQFEDPVNLFEHTHFDGPMPSSGCGSGNDCVCHYDSADPLDLHPSQSGIIERFDDNGRDFAPKPWYSCKMKSNCLPGERDTGEYCTKEGCPNGMQRGANIGSEFCYPTCAPGYENDGGGRCYKVCPEGYLTQGNDCIRPKHEFKKDVIPCKGCAQQAVPRPMPQIPIIVQPGPVMMNPIFDRWSSNAFVRTDVKYPSTHTHRTFNDKRNITHGHDTTTSFMYPSTNGPAMIGQAMIGQAMIGQAMIEPFLQTNKSLPELLNNNTLEPSQTNSVAIIEKMANDARADIPTCVGKECTKPKGGLVWRVEDRISVNELPCPLGYTLSGDMCYENCPANYLDTGDGCVLDRYSVPRPSYDRGSGVPFATKRSKYLNINPISQTN